MLKPVVLAITLAIATTALKDPGTSITWLPNTELRCLVDNIYHEARGEPFQGQILVATTTLNRVATEGYPDTVCGVVYQTKQFSWTRRGKKTDRQSKEYYVAWQAAWAAKDRIEPYLYYHAVRVRPRWSKLLGKPYQIGNHKFYE